MVAVGKDAVLVGQIGAPRIDQINARQIVLAGDFLRPKMLLHRDRIIGAALDRRVIGDDHAFRARNRADAGDDSRRGDIVVIHAKGGERREFEKRRAGVEQSAHPFMHRQLAPLDMTRHRRGAAALRGECDLFAKIGDQRAHARGVGLEFLRAGLEGRL